jgi:hypothetical protein
LVATEQPLLVRPQPGLDREDDQVAVQIIRTGLEQPRLLAELEEAHGLAGALELALVELMRRVGLARDLLRTEQTTKKGQFASNRGIGDPLSLAPKHVRPDDLDRDLVQPGVDRAEHLLEVSSKRRALLCQPAAYTAS